MFCSVSDVSIIPKSIHNKMEKRQARMTKIQKERFISLLEQHKFLLEKLKPADIPKSKNCWSQIATALNELPGAQKSVKGWKDALNEMKVTARKRARLLNIEAKGTGGGPKKLRDLTELEERLLALLSRVVITGLPGVEELGVDIGENEEYLWPILQATENPIESEENENIEIIVENENEENMVGLDDEAVQEVMRKNSPKPTTLTSRQTKKRKRVETVTERLARNHEKCLKILAQSNNNLAQATYTRAKLNYTRQSAVFSLSF